MAFEAFSQTPDSFSTLLYRKYHRNLQMEIVTVSKMVALQPFIFVFPSYISCIYIDGDLHLTRLKSAPEKQNLSQSELLLNMNSYLTNAAR